MDEGRKRVILIAASILAARGLAHWRGVSPAGESLILDSIEKAEAIMRAIDRRWPIREAVKPNGRDPARR